MANETHGYGIVDPLADYWGLSLFPQTSGVQPQQPSNPYNPDDDLHFSDNHLRSTVWRSPCKFMEQVESIVDSHPRQFNSENLVNPASNEINDIVADDAKKNPRERRLGLGLQRVRFSLKPNKNHTTENLIPTLDIDKLKDPLEFFKAFEVLENATREIQKQVDGVIPDKNQKNASTRVRQCRPGLLGNNQRPVRYKHLFPSKSLENKENVQSSQETFEPGTFGLGESTDKTGTHIDTMENELADSSANEKNKIKYVLDELLLSNCEDLEGDGAITRLQESLQIKPFVLRKLSIPEFPDNQETYLKSFGGRLSKPRKALSNMDNLLKNMSEKQPVRQRQDLGSTPQQQLASPTPPKSSFALLSSLQKRISQSKPSVDPFSAVDIDHSSTRNSSPTDAVNEELSLADPGNSFNEQDEPPVEDMIEVGIGGSVENTVRNCASTSKNSKQDNSKETDLGNNVGSNGFLVEMEVNVGYSDVGDIIMDDAVNRPVSEANETCKLEDKAEEESMQEAVASVQEENMQEAVASAPMVDQEPTLRDPLEQPIPAGCEANGMDQCASTVDVSEQHREEETGVSLLLVNEKRKGKLLQRNKGKEKGHCQRQSLAAAGTAWVNGVRRSNRTRTRPLEYWKGERPVYGRIHDSLPTVIGLKYMSPGTADGKPNLKVKSYVSDKYKELLELASLH